MGELIGRAIRKLAAAKSISIGQAKEQIREACENGIIRARWPHYLGSRAIPRQDFAGADIDVEKDVLILRNGERKGDVYLDEDDFAAWLSDHATIQVASEPADPPIVVQDQVEPRPKKSRKTYPRARAEQALATLFNGKIPPVEDLPGPALSAQVNAWIKADCDKRQLKFVAIGDDTIERAAGRRE